MILSVQSFACFSRKSRVAKTQKRPPALFTLLIKAKYKIKTKIDFYKASHLKILRKKNRTFHQVLSKNDNVLGIE